MQFNKGIKFLNVRHILKAHSAAEQIVTSFKCTAWSRHIKTGSESVCVCAGDHCEIGHILSSSLANYYAFPISLTLSREDSWGGVKKCCPGRVGTSPTWMDAGLVDICTQNLGSSSSLYNFMVWHLVNCWLFLSLRVSPELQWLVLLGCVDLQRFLLALCGSQWERVMPFWWFLEYSAKCLNKVGFLWME